MIASTQTGRGRWTYFVARIFPALLVSIFVLGGTRGSAQSLGDLARQERERVRNHTSGSTRVFTNEDLARPKILEGGERDDAAEPPSTARSPLAPNSSAAGETAAIPIAVPVWPEGMPLGDVARYYRRLQELQSPPAASPELAQDAPAAPASPAPHQQAGPMPPAQPLRPQKRIEVPPPAAAHQVAAAARVVRVTRGDSLWKIAARHLGDGSQWREIAAANPEIADPNRIQVGQQIRLPGGATAESAAFDAAPQQVRVQAGDSLWKLAEAHWGTGAAWSCIAQSNPQIQDASRIYPDQTLALPVNCSSVL
jgi:nucleoid-associated protein YgaU